MAVSNQKDIKQSWKSAIRHQTMAVSNQTYIKLWQSVVRQKPNQSAINQTHQTAVSNQTHETMAVSNQTHETMAVSNQPDTLNHGNQQSTRHIKPWQSASNQTH